VSALHHAETLRPHVIRMVNTFGNSRKTAEHLLGAIETDLTDPRARQAFEDHAPAIVQKLAMMDESKADYETVRTVELDRGGLGRRPQPWVRRAYTCNVPACALTRGLASR
jgi:hypothetical protein